MSKRSIKQAIAEQVGDGGPASRNLELERVVLGAALVELENYQAVEGVLSADDFTDQTHQFVWTKLRALVQEGIRPDRTALLAFLHRRNEAGKVQPEQLDAMIQAATARPVDVQASAQVLHQCTVARHLVGLANQIQSGATSGRSVETIIGQAEQFLDHLRVTAVHEQTDFTLEETVEALPGGLDELINPWGHNPGVPSPFARLNDLLHGFHRKELTILGARPSVGKSLIGGQIACHAALRGKSICYFAHEMAKEAVYRRIIAQMAHVRPRDMRDGTLTPVEYQRVKNAYEQYKRMPLRINDINGRTTLSMAGALRRFRVKYGLDLVVVDYIQLMVQRGSRAGMAEQIPQLYNDLKQMTRDINTAIIAIAALSRAPNLRSGEEKRPTMADLLYGGEYAGDGVMLLDRPGTMLPKNHPKRTNDATLIVAKQRDGPTGDVPLKFDEEYVRFIEPSEAEAEKAAEEAKQASFDDEEDEHPW